MANIAFPAVTISSLDLGLRWPGQTIHESLYTSERQVITRGIGVWSGRFTWDLRSRIQQANDIRLIEVFLAQLEGSANTFDIPIHQANESQASRFANGTNLSVSAAVRSGSSMALTLSEDFGLLVGDYITIDNRLFQCVTPLLERSVLVTPYRQLPTTNADKTNIIPNLAVLWQSPTIRARRTSNTQISNVRDLDWAGPWTVEFEAHA